MSDIILLCISLGKNAAGDSNAKNKSFSHHFFGIITFKEAIFRQPDGKSYEVIMQYRQLLFCESKGKS